MRKMSLKVCGLALCAIIYMGCGEPPEDTGHEELPSLAPDVDTAVEIPINNLQDTIETGVVTGSEIPSNAMPATSQPDSAVAGKTNELPTTFCCSTHNPRHCCTQDEIPETKAKYKCDGFK
jgi:hypothetical protein